MSATLKSYALVYSDNCTEKHNNSILKIMETQVQAQTKELSNCFHKIKNLASELSLTDGLKYLKNFFGNYVLSSVRPPPAEQDSPCQTRPEEQGTDIRKHHPDT